MQEISGIPWRNWVPDFQIPKVCQIDGCEHVVTRVIWWSGTMTDGVISYTMQQQSFVCDTHGDEIQRFVNLKDK
jgi:hypothetical protein